MEPLEQKPHETPLNRLPEIKYKSTTKKVYSNRTHDTRQKTIQYDPTDKEGLKKAKQLLNEWAKTIEDDNKQLLQQNEQHQIAKQTEQLIKTVEAQLPDNKVTNDLRVDKTKITTLEKAQKIISKNQVRKDPYTNNIPQIQVQDVVNKIIQRMQDESGANMAVFGSSGSGKTTIIKSILSEIQIRRPEQIITLFSPSISAPIYKTFHKDIIQVPDLDENLIECQRKINKQIQTPYNWLNVSDDILDTGKSISQLRSFLTDRNLKISNIVAIQDAKLLQKKARGSVNYVLLGRMNSREAQKSCAESFLLGFGIFPDKNWDHIYEIMDQLTSNHSWLFLDQLEGKIYRI